ncbi:MAG: hypothetical protein Q8R53_01990 [Nanoarchaeota archaeon]|nr:hypothetical protein [Nanoarchaeota archaeon]
MIPEEREMLLAANDAFAFVYEETARYWKRLGFLQGERGNFFSPIHNLEITLRDEAAPRLHVLIQLDYSVYPIKSTGNAALVELYEADVEACVEKNGFEILPVRASSSHPADSARIDFRLEYWVWPLLH